MTRVRKVDRNQGNIVQSLRAVGVSVAITSSLGDGFPDIVAGYDGRSYLLEIKAGNQGLTEDEAEWHANWRGQVAVVRTAEEAIRIVREDWEG